MLSFPLVSASDWVSSVSLKGQKMPLGNKIKELRKEKGWSQGKLAEEIGSDTRQISRYEKSHITPSVEVVIKMAQVFDVSIDYLLVDGIPRRPLKLDDYGIGSKLKDISRLSEEDRNTLLKVFEALLMKSKVRSLASDLEPGDM